MAMCLIISSAFYLLVTTFRFETVWDPVIVPGAPKQISYNFLDAVRELLYFVDL